MIRAFRLFALAPVLVLGASTCLPARPEPDGTCQPEPAGTIDCTAPGYGGANVESGMQPYSCSGTARPDQSPRYAQGTPEGLLCGDKGPLGDTGRTGYCCTPTKVDCVYDQADNCDDSTFGVRCRGGNRPESLNPVLNCSNGLWVDEYTDYCCSAKTRSSCQQLDSLGCTKNQMGFSCPVGELPTGEDLGPNKSRADYFHPTCSIPKVPPNPNLRGYCCFMPAPRPIGGTCVNHTTLEGCDPGRWGFACYGPDRPEENNLPMKCDPPKAGKSAEGYPATTYCCDFKLAE